MASWNNKNPVSVNIDFIHQIFGDRLKVKKKIIEIEWNLFFSLNRTQRFGDERVGDAVDLQ